MYGAGRRASSDRGVLRCIATSEQRRSSDRTARASTSVFWASRTPRVLARRNRLARQSEEQTAKRVRNPEGGKVESEANSRSANPGFGSERSRKGLGLLEAPKGRRTSGEEPLGDEWSIEVATRNAFERETSWDETRDVFGFRAARIRQSPKGSQARERMTRMHCA